MERDNLLGVTDTFSSTPADPQRGLPQLYRSRSRLSSEISEDGESRSRRGSLSDAVNITNSNLVTGNRGILNTESRNGVRDHDNRVLLSDDKPVKPVLDNSSNEFQVSHVLPQPILKDDLLQNITVDAGQSSIMSEPRPFISGVFTTDCQQRVSEVAPPPPSLSSRPPPLRLMSSTEPLPLNSPVLSSPGGVAGGVARTGLPFLSPLRTTPTPFHTHSPTIKGTTSKTFSIREPQLMPTTKSPDIPQPPQSSLNSSHSSSLPATQTNKATPPSLITTGNTNTSQSSLTQENPEPIKNDNHVISQSELKTIEHTQISETIPAVQVLPDATLSSNEEQEEEATEEEEIANTSQDQSTHINLQDMTHQLEQEKGKEKGDVEGDMNLRSVEEKEAESSDDEMLPLSETGTSFTSQEEEEVKRHRQTEDLEKIDNLSHQTPSPSNHMSPHRHAVGSAAISSPLSEEKIEAADNLHDDNESVSSSNSSISSMPQKSPPKQDLQTGLVAVETGLSSEVQVEAEVLGSGNWADHHESQVDAQIDKTRRQDVDTDINMEEGGEGGVACILDGDHDDMNLPDINEQIQLSESEDDSSTSGSGTTSGQASDIETETTITVSNNTLKKSEESSFLRPPYSYPPSFRSSSHSLASTPSLSPSPSPIPHSSQDSIPDVNKQQRPPSHQVQREDIQTLHPSETRHNVLGPLVVTFRTDLVASLRGGSGSDRNVGVAKHSRHTPSTALPVQLITSKASLHHRKTTKSTTTKKVKKSSVLKSLHPTVNFEPTPPQLPLVISIPRNILHHHSSLRMISDLQSGFSFGNEDDDDDDVIVTHSSAEQVKFKTPTERVKPAEHHTQDWFPRQQSQGPSADIVQYPSSLSPGTGGQGTSVWQRELDIGLLSSAPQPPREQQVKD